MSHPRPGWMTRYTGRVQMMPLILTDGDVELFRWLWLLRVSTLEQLRRVRYYQPETGRLSSPDNVRKRLARLARAGYLMPEEILREGSMSRQRVYFLGEAALEPLRHRYGIDQRRLYRITAGSALTFIHHALWVTEFAVRTTECLRGTEADTVNLAPLGVPFLHTHMVENARKKRHVERYVTQEDVHVPGLPEPLRIRPDLVFALRMKGASRLYFLEIDRGTEGRGQIEAKLTAYAHYAGTDRWRRYAPASDFRVLFVTTTGKRVDSFLTAFASHPLASKAAFTTMAAVDKQDILKDPIWQTATGQRAGLLVSGSSSAR